MNSISVLLEPPPSPSLQELSTHITATFPPPSHCHRLPLLLLDRHLASTLHLHPTCIHFQPSNHSSVLPLGQDMHGFSE
ncbi:hypothetical protein E2C01_102864 [Portunus trituberculatus]|uniref:Uncharacterized protein n=1 Tax=Portunus trituberculatus TaxID=210409 RepID=A0A5B7KEB9_PORTR|nr:hypothetical protein [Portunus trituberculatus]